MCLLLMNPKAIRAFAHFAAIAAGSIRKHLRIIFRNEIEVPVLLVRVPSKVCECLEVLAKINALRLLAGVVLDYNLTRIGPDRVAVKLEDVIQSPRRECRLFVPASMSFAFFFCNSGS